MNPADAAKEAAGLAGHASALLDDAASILEDSKISGRELELLEQAIGTVEKALRLLDSISAP